MLLFISISKIIGTTLYSKNQIQILVLLWAVSDSVMITVLIGRLVPLMLKRSNNTWSDFPVVLSANRPVRLYTTPGSGLPHH